MQQQQETTTEIVVTFMSRRKKDLHLDVSRAPRPGWIDEKNSYQLSEEEAQLKEVIDQYKRDVEIGGGTFITLPLDEFKKNTLFFEHVMNFQIKFNEYSTLARSIGPTVSLYYPLNERKRARRRYEEGGVKALRRDLALMKSEQNPGPVREFLDGLFGSLMRTRDQKALAWAIQVYEEEIAKYELLEGKK